VLDAYGVPCILAALLALTASHKPLRAEHYLLTAVFTVLAWLGPATRRFSWAMLPFAVGGLAYENFELLAPLRGPVHVADLYRAELSLFSVQGQIPAQWWQTHTHPVLDLVTGAAYAIYLPWILGVAFILYFRERERTHELAWGFLLCNLIGIAFWLGFAAAPPWYVAQHGLGPALEHVAPSAAGAARFDSLVGTHYFANFYTRSTNVFGAMPSLHVAYPMLAVFATRSRGRTFRAVTSLFVAIVAFAAVYLDHHYVLDVIAGVVVAYLTQQIVLVARSKRAGVATTPAGQPCP
jgi:membrane-associated phospholipid phosphatase